MIAERPELFDEARPYRRIFACDATGRFVKIHTRKVDLPFGQLAWRLTGSECDSQGNAKAEGEGFRILCGPDGEPASHIVQCALESEVDAARALHEGREELAGRVLRAAIFHDSASSAF